MPGVLRKSSRSRLPQALSERIKRCSTLLRES